MSLDESLERTAEHTVDSAKQSNVAQNNWMKALKELLNMWLILQSIALLLICKRKSDVSQSLERTAKHAVDPAKHSVVAQRDRMKALETHS